MKERPILFRDEMVRAILDGRKTQTRRVVKNGVQKCPYGQAGDRLWVRETYGLDPYRPGVILYRATDCDCPARWKPSMYMPRKFARITLDIISIKLAQVQDISEQDAKSEGVIPQSVALAPGIESYVAPFVGLWDSINGNTLNSWEANPRVWVITFRRADA
jgi:hypothetical protein